MTNQETGAALAICVLVALLLATVVLTGGPTRGKRSKLSDWLAECQDVNFTENQCRFFRDGVKWREHLDDKEDSR